MTHAAPSHAFELTVLTLREGLLSRFGHDLLLTLPGTLHKRVAATPGSVDVEVEIDLAAMHVRGAMVDGRLDSKALSNSDCEKIARAYAHEVMHCHDFPRAFFRTSVTAPQIPPLVQGHLDLHGHVHPLTVNVVAHEGRLNMQAQIQPSHWGIAPYRAMAGTLRVADQVTVSASLPLGLAA